MKLFISGGTGQHRLVTAPSSQGQDPVDPHLRLDVIPTLVHGYVPSLDGGGTCVPDPRGNRAQGGPWSVVDVETTSLPPCKVAAKSLPCHIQVTIHSFGECMGLVEARGVFSENAQDHHDARVCEAMCRPTVLGLAIVAS